ncbi:hypothetical protein DITRI_Ditri18aG0045300 [Diplodiscus trichospermus]
MEIRGRQSGKPTPTFSLLVIIFSLTLFLDATAAQSHDPDCPPYRRMLPPIPRCRNHPISPSSAPLTPPPPTYLATPPIPELSPPPPFPNPPTPPHRRPLPPPCVPIRRSRCPDQSCPPPIRICPEEPCPPYRRCPPLLSKRGRVYASPPKDK